MTIPLQHSDEYTIDFDDAAKVLLIALRGHWNEASLTRYNAAIADAVNTIVGRYCRRGEQLVLVDVTGFSIQSPAVLEGLAAAALDRKTAGRKTALVLSSALLTMQAKRAAPHYAMFADRQTALAWLGEDE